MHSRQLAIQIRFAAAMICTLSQCSTFTTWQHKNSNYTLKHFAINRKYVTNLLWLAKVLQMQLTTGIDWEGTEIGGSGGSENYRTVDMGSGFNFTSVSHWYRSSTLIECMYSDKRDHRPWSMKSLILYIKKHLVHIGARNMSMTQPRISPRSW